MGGRGRKRGEEIEGGRGWRGRDVRRERKGGEEREEGRGGDRGREGRR